MEGAGGGDVAGGGKERKKRREIEEGREKLEQEPGQILAGPLLIRRSIGGYLLSTILSLGDTGNR